MENKNFYYTGAIISLIAIFPFPTGFYYATRIVLCFILLFITYELYKSRFKFWVFPAPLAILYNPIFPIYLHSKSLWVVINIVTTIIIMISFFLKKDESIKLKALNEYCENKKDIEDDSIIKESLTSSKAHHLITEHGIKRPDENDNGSLLEKIKRLHELLNQTLNSQFELGGVFADEQKPNSDFIVGYIVGYADGFLVNNGIDNNSPEGFSVPSIAFIDIFGLDEGPKLFSDFLDTQLNMSYEMENGRKSGYDDAFGLLEKNTKPLGLSQYLHKFINTASSKEDIAASPIENNVLTEYDDERALALAYLIKSFMMKGSGTLLGQFVRQGFINSKDIPKDDWILGYIAGFVDAQLNDWKLKEDVNFVTTFTNSVFVNIYDSTAEFRLFLSLFEAEDEQIINGCSEGIADYQSKKNDGDSKVLTKLSLYVLEKKYIT